MEPAHTKPYFAFDASERAILSASGKDVLDLLQRVSTNDLAGLAVGEARPTILLNEKGRILEVITVVRTAAVEFFLIAESPRGAELLSKLERYVFLEDAHFKLVTGSRRHLIIYRLHRSDTQSSHEIEWSNSLPCRELSQSTAVITFNDFSVGAAVRHVLLTADHANLGPVLPESCTTRVDSALFEDHRIFLGIPAIDKELGPEFNPLETGLDHLVSTKKGCYPGQEVLARIVTYEKLSWRLMNFVAAQYVSQLPLSIFRGEQEVGIVTSCMTNGGEHPLRAMGFLRKSYWHDTDPFTSEAGPLYIQHKPLSDFASEPHTAIEGNRE